MVAPIVDVEAGSAVFHVQLQRRNARVVVCGQSDAVIPYHKSFSVKVIGRLQIRAVDVLVSAVNGDIASFRQRQDKSQSEQLDVFLEPRFGFDVTSKIIGEINEVKAHFGFCN